MLAIKVRNTIAEQHTVNLGICPLVEPINEVVKPDIYLQAALLLAKLRSTTGTEQSKKVSTQDRRKYFHETG